MDDDQKPKNTGWNKSIHPRVVNGRTRHEKVDTSEPNKNQKNDRTLKRYDKRQQWYRDTLKSVSIGNQTGWRKPGSRNPKRVSG